MTAAEYVTAARVLAPKILAKAPRALAAGCRFINVYAPGTWDTNTDVRPGAVMHVELRPENVADLPRALLASAVTISPKPYELADERRISLEDAAEVIAHEYAEARLADSVVIVGQGAADARDALLDALLASPPPVENV